MCISDLFIKSIYHSHFCHYKAAEKTCSYQVHLSFVKQNPSLHAQNHLPVRISINSTLS